MRLSILFLAFTVLMASCKNAAQKNRGAIILGDSSTIITETDPAYMTDFVEDIQLRNTVANSERLKDTAIAAPVQPVVDTALKPDVKESALVVPGKGLTIDFSEVSIFIPNIETQSFRNQNLKTLNGVSYQLQNGDLESNKLIIKNATISSVKQRYITTVIITNDGKKMELDELDETTSWTDVKGSKGIYPIRGIAPGQLSYKKATSGAIRTAVSRAARSNRYSRKEIQEWERIAKKIRSVTQPPANVVLQSIMWRIDGKDKNGKSFRKEVRIDMPI